MVAKVCHVFVRDFWQKSQPKWFLSAAVSKTMRIVLILCKFLGGAISRELCDRMRFLPDYAKSHHRILSEALHTFLYNFNSLDPRPPRRTVSLGCLWEDWDEDVSVVITRWTLLRLLLILFSGLFAVSVSGYFWSRRGERPSPNTSFKIGTLFRAGEGPLPLHYHYNDNKNYYYHYNDHNNTYYNYYYYC